MSILSKLAQATTDCLWAASNGANVDLLLETLAPLQSEATELLHSQAEQIRQLQSNPTLQKARLTRAMKAEARRNEQIFQLTWQGGGTEHVTGWSAIAKKIGYRESTIRAKLSIGGECFTMKFKNPVTMEPDILTVTRLPLDLGATRKKQPGRPRKAQYDAERLGTEFAPPARTVPK